MSTKPRAWYAGLPAKVEKPAGRSTGSKRDQVALALSTMAVFECRAIGRVAPIFMHDTVRKRKTLRDKRFRSFTDQGILYVVRLK